MKLIKYLILIFPLFGYSQEITLSYNKSQVGKNIRLGCGFDITPKFIIEPGLKYIVWTGVSDNEGNVFKDRFRPINFIEHFGLYTNFKYSILKNEFITVYILYSGSFSYSHLIIDGLYLYSNDVYDANGVLIPEDFYLRHFEEMTKTKAFENYIGGELDFKLHKKVNGFANCGLGMTIYHLDDLSKIIMPSSISKEYSWFMFTLGIKIKL
jgi:hypothetical protein